jgi:putative sterol carrier protein
VTKLTGFSGRLVFQVEGKTVAILQVDEHRVELLGGGKGGEARAVGTCKSEDDVRKILNGELDAVVAALQGRLTFDGDMLFAMKVLRALRAAPRTGAPRAGG